jgi:two-component system, sensor histidine kinase PdtaS
MKQSILKKYFFLFPALICWLFTETLSAQNKRIDSLFLDVKKLENISGNITSDTSLIVSYYAIAEEYYELQDRINEQIFTKKALGQINKLFDHPGISLEVKKYLLKEQAIGYGNIGSYYTSIADYPKALDYNFKALKIDESIDNKIGISRHFINIANCYGELGDHEKALDYNFKALALAKVLHKYDTEALLYGNISTEYSDVFNNKMALHYADIALGMYQNQKDTIGIAMTLGTIGAIYSDLGDNKLDRKINPKEISEYYTASAHYKKALELSRITGQKSSEAIYLGGLGGLYRRMKKYDEAKSTLLQSLELSREIDDLYGVMESSKNLSLLFSEIGDDGNELKYYKNYIAVRDTIFNKEKTEENVRTEMNYDFEKKEALTKFENDKIIFSLGAENKLQEQLRFFLILMTALGLILLYFLKRAYNNKKHLAEFLALEDTRKETLLQEVHHRIGNNLQIISSLLSLQANSAKDEKIYRYLAQSQSRIQSLAVLHDLLYQNDSQLQINMKEYINKVLNFHKEIASGLSIEIKIEMNVFPIAFPSKLAVPIALIINELVTNSFKYAFSESRGGQIKITLLPSEKNENEWNLSVSDNGKGLSIEGDSLKSNLGLELVKMMAKQLKATINVLSDKGTTVEIVFNSSAVKTTGNKYLIK